MEVSRESVPTNNNLFNLVELSKREKNKRELNKKKLCKKYIKGFTTTFILFFCYILFGYIGKVFWYYDNTNAINYNIIDLEQFVSAITGYWLCLGFYATIKWYCPLCTNYSSYDRGDKRNQQFWWYQFIALCWILVFFGLIEAVEIAFV
jgi:hypothetical protein